MAIILVQNEKTATGDFDHYEDVTGKTYQYPNRYKGIILPGELFIYYRGLRKRDGTRRKAVEYFGYGIVESVSKNEELSQVNKSGWIWDCILSDYQEFEMPVIAKKDGEGIFEKITNNRWGNVRRIPKDVALSIISNGSKKYSHLKKVNPPELLVENKINHFKNNINDDNELNVFSKRAKLIGDLGESYVFNFLKNKRVKNLRWLANENIKPGWDIEFLDEHNSLKCIEVKSTTKKYFSSIQITKNEWDAAKRKGKDYELWLLTEVESATPKVSIIQDFKSCVPENYILDPLIYRLKRSS